MSIIDFFKNLFGKVASLGSSYNFSTEEFVIDFLISQVNREDLIQSQIEAYKEAKHKHGQAKVDAYVHLYLELESFITHNKPLVVKEALDKTALREKVKGRYPTEDLHPQFRLIFMSATHQYAHVFAIGFNHILQYMVDSFGTQHAKNVVSEIMKGSGIVAWVKDDGRVDPDKSAEVYKNFDPPILINTFKRLLREEHKKITEELGRLNADTTFAKASEYIKNIYDYDITVLFLEMVPEHIAAKERLTYLSRTELEDRVIKATADEKAKRALAEELSQELAVAKSKVEELVKMRTRQLHEEQARMAASIDSLLLGFVIFDKQGKVFRVNQAIQRILHRTTIQTIDDIEQLIDGDTKIRSLFDVCVNERKQLSLPEVHSQQKYLRIFFSPVTITDTDEIIGAAMVVEDITKEIEIDHAKTDFVMLASHQLRTPLTIIKWNTELLKKTLGDKVDDKAMKYFNTVQDGSLRMMALIQALLNVSRIETGKLALSPKEMDVAELCHGLVTELQKDLSDKQLVVTEKYDTGLPKVISDPDVISMVIENLLTNAIKYTPEKGSITVSVTKTPDTVPVDKKPKVPSLLVCVADTGLGIPNDQQDKIYTKLFRARNVELTKTSGTGLGLYIAKGAIEASGGSIWFESEEGKGTKFYVTIPIQGEVKKEGVSFLTHQDPHNLLYS